MIAAKYNKAGKEALEKKQLTTAKELLEKAIKADPKFDAPHGNLGEVHNLLGRFDDAIIEYSKAIELNPNNPNYYLRLGIIFHENKNEEDAVEALLNAKKLAPENLQTYYYLGIAYMALRERDKAQQNLAILLGLMDKEKSWRSDSNMVTMYWKANKYMAEIYRTQKNWKQAKAYYEKILLGDADANFKRSIEMDYKFVKEQESPLYAYVAYAMGFILIFVLMFSFHRYVLLPQLKKSQEADLASASQAQTYEGLARFALKHLKLQTSMPKALIYFTRFDGEPMSLVLAENLEKKRYEHLNVSWDELYSWLSMNFGRPFIFDDEKNEIPFARAFPGAREKLETAGARIGVPFVSDDDLVGMAFMCYHQMVDESEKKKLRKSLAKHQELIKQLASEVAASADEILRRRMSSSDRVTQAGSQLYFKEKFPEELNLCAEKHAPLSLIILECDGMGPIQKRFSDEGKNKVLRTVAQVLTETIRKQKDSLFRISDYRFAIIMPGSDESMAKDSAEKMREEVAETHFTSPIPNITMSAGVACYPFHGENAEELTASARKALDQAIESGRNKVVLAKAIDSGAKPSPRRGSAMQPVASAPGSMEPKSTPPPRVLPSSPISPRMGGAQPPTPPSPTPPIREERSQAKAADHQRIPIALAPSPENTERNKEPRTLEGKAFRKAKPREEPGQDDQSEDVKMTVTVNPPPPQMENRKAKLTPAPLLSTRLQGDGKKENGEQRSQPLKRKDSQGSLDPMNKPSMAQRPKKQGSAPQQGAPPAKAAPDREKPKKVHPKDPVTGFMQEIYFKRALEKLIANATKNRHHLSILLFQIDKHQSIREKYNTEKVDGILRKMGSEIVTIVREGNDVPARLGEDVFCIILPGASHQTAFNVAEQIRYAVGKLDYPNINEKITLSVGISSFPKKGRTIVELITRAREALDAAIEDGGDHSLIWENKLK